MEIEKNKVTKKYIKKNGEEVVKTYNQKLYNTKYYNKNKDNIIKKDYKCECCNVIINKLNKSNHEKTKKHILRSKYNININSL
jgi:hypothetical protein